MTKIPTHRFTFTEQSDYTQYQKARQMGKSYMDEFGQWDTDAIKKLKEEMERKQFDDRQFRQEFQWQRGTNRRLDDSKLQFAAQIIYENHKVRIDIRYDTFGDYVEVRMGTDKTVRISNTDLAVKDPSWLIHFIEEGLGLVRNVREKLDTIKKATPVS